jgi:hypothetical protein
VICAIASSVGALGDARPSWWTSRWQNKQRRSQPSPPYSGRRQPPCDASARNGCQSKRRLGRRLGRAHAVGHQSSLHCWPGLPAGTHSLAHFPDSSISTPIHPLAHRTLELFLEASRSPGVPTGCSRWPKEGSSEFVRGAQSPGEPRLCEDGRKATFLQTARVLILQRRAFRFPPQGRVTGLRPAATDPA